VEQMTLAQLERAYCRLYRRNLGAQTWDWRTLRICYPSLAFTLRALVNEMKTRNYLRGYN
jgi:hypothetical protein